jgi:uncharacterized protein (TIGR03083 family)
VQLSPRYDGPVVIDVAAAVADPATAVIRQRDRLADELSTLTAEEWAAASRCDGWSVQDVAEHLASVNRFWLASIRAGLGGEPTRFLATFDPVTVPAAIVEQARGTAAAATLDKLVSSNAELSAVLGALTEDEWETVAEAPPGHIGLSGVAAHALWDAWVHERDVLLPLGRDQRVEADEVAITLAYAAALGPSFYVNAGVERTGSLAVQGRRPDVTFTVEVAQQVTVRPGVDLQAASAVIAGDAVDLIEGLSARADLPPVDADCRWLVDGLLGAFDAG